MVEYTFQAYPTYYRGVRYRSRLEARWAAFFDLLGWTALYEPYDLGKWSPDFLLTGETGCILVEIKPIRSFDADCGSKMAEAAVASKISLTIEGLLLVGASPRHVNATGAVELGWCSKSPIDGHAWWHEATLAWLPCGRGRPNAPDVVLIDCPEPFWATAGLFNSGWKGNDPPFHLCDPRRVSLLWGEAGNRVQWNPKKEGAR